MEIASSYLKLGDDWLWGRNWAAESFDFSGAISLLNQAASGPSTKPSFVECRYILLDSPHPPIHLLCLMILVLREAGSLLSLAPLPSAFGSDLVLHCVFPITGVYSSLNSIWSPEYYLLQSKMEAQVITKREAGSDTRAIWDSAIGQCPLLPGPPPFKDPLRTNRGRGWLLRTLWALRLNLELWEVFSRPRFNCVFKLSSKEMEKVQLPFIPPHKPIILQFSAPTRPS